MTVGGVQVLVNNGGNDWMVDNTRLKTNAEGLGYRRSKRLDDKDDNRFMSWGTVVKGIDTGDGWLQVKVTKARKNKYNHVKHHYVNMCHHATNTYCNAIWVSGGVAEIPFWRLKGDASL